MKVVIIGDCHFGAGYSYGRPDPETGINSRLLEYEKTLSNIITYAIKNKIELVVFLGDIFETRNPTSQQSVCFYRQLKRLSNAGITIYILMGNHDMIKTRKINSTLDPIKEIHMSKVSVFTDIDLVHFVDSNNEHLNVLMMPYRNRQSYDKPTNEESLMEMANEINIAKGKAIVNCPILLCGHMMMESTISSDAGDFGLNELILPFDIFNGIDIVINGHIHRSSVLKELPVFVYSGSMETKDFSERDHQKCFLIYDTTKSGIEAITFKAISTKKFIDFAFDYSIDFPEDPMNKIIKEIYNETIKDSVVRFNVKVPETKLSFIDTNVIRNKLIELGAECISDVSVSPVISKQLRNQKVNDAVNDDVSAFKHYVLTQTNVDDNVLSLGLAVIATDVSE